MKRTIAFFAVTSVIVLLTAVGFTYAAGSGVKTQIGSSKNILTDGDMEKMDVSDWDYLSSCTTGSKVPGAANDGHRVLRISADGLCYFPATQGKTYRYTGWARGDGVATIPRVGNGQTGGNVYTGTASNQWQYFDKVVQNSYIVVALNALNGSGYAEFDDIAVTEMPTANTNNIRQKTVLGSKNLVTDSDFESNAAPYFVGYNTTAEKVPGAAKEGKKVLRLTYLSSATMQALAPVYPTVGKTYHLTGWARGNGTANPRVAIRGGQTLWTGTASTEWQRIDVTAKILTYNQLDLYTSAGSGNWIEFDDIVFVEAGAKTVTGSKNVLTDGDMEKEDSTVDFPNIILSAGIYKVPGAVIDGNRLLELQSAPASGDVMYCSFSNLLTKGKSYRVTGWARGDGTSRPRLHDFLVGDFWTGTTSNVWQKIDRTFTARSGYACVYGTGVAGHPAQYDDLVISEL